MIKVNRLVINSTGAGNALGNDERTYNEQLTVVFIEEIAQTERLALIKATPASTLPKN